jgi:hypothetical protein
MVRYAIVGTRVGKVKKKIEDIGTESEVDIQHLDFHTYPLNFKHGAILEDFVWYLETGGVSAQYQ